MVALKGRMTSYYHIAPYRRDLVGCSSLRTMSRNMSDDSLSGETCATTSTTEMREVMQPVPTYYDSGVEPRIQPKPKLRADIWTEERIPARPNRPVLSEPLPTKSSLPSCSSSSSSRLHGHNLTE